MKKEKNGTVAEAEVQDIQAEEGAGYTAPAGASPPFLGEASPLPQEAPPRRTKIAIVGFADSWPMAPYHHPEWDIACLNQFYDLTGAAGPAFESGKVNLGKVAADKRLIWYDLHSRHDLECDPNVISRHPHHVQRLRELGALGVPIWMQQAHADIPNSQEYPLKAMMEMFGNYWTNSVSYMIALAIADKYAEIGLYGVNMAQDCLAPEMRVLTADLRWVRAGDLAVGQELLAFDEEVPVTLDGERAQFRKYRKTAVESLSTAKRPCYQLHMADGSQLVCSEGHQWLTLGGIQNSRRWLRTDQICSRENRPKHATKIVRLTQVWDEDRSWDAGYLAAAFDGEGHVSQVQHRNCATTNLSVGFAQKPNAMTAQVVASMDRMGFQFRESQKGTDCTKFTIKGSRAEQMRFLGTVRPRRLLERLNGELTGSLNSVDDTPLLSKVAIGERETVGITTGTQTLIVEGFASHNSEYSHQRPSCEYMVGFARGQGITVRIPVQSDLLKAPYLYAFEDDKSDAMIAKIDEMAKSHQAQMIDWARKRDEAEAYHQQFNGAFQASQAMKRMWTIGK